MKSDVMFICDVDGGLLLCHGIVTFRASRHGQTDSWSKNFALKGPCSRFDLASAVMLLPERQRRGAVAGKRVRGLRSAPMSSCFGANIPKG